MPHILELAKRGAEHRYQELKAEVESLVKLFPHLRGHSGGSPGSAYRDCQARPPPTSSPQDERGGSEGTQRPHEEILGGKAEDEEGVTSVPPDSRVRSDGRSKTTWQVGPSLLSPE
jgi:hypothetical protein